LIVSSVLVWTANAAPSKPVPGTVYVAEWPQETSAGKDLSVFCPTGQRASGGGGYVFATQAPTFLTTSVPIDSGGAPALQGELAVGWHVAATFDLTVTNSWGLRGYVVCE